MTLAMRVQLGRHELCLNRAYTECKIKEAEYARSGELAAFMNNRMGDCLNGCTCAIALAKADVCIYQNMMDLVRLNPEAIANLALDCFKDVQEDCKEFIKSRGEDYVPSWARGTDNDK